MRIVIVIAIVARRGQPLHPAPGAIPRHFKRRRGVVAGRSTAEQAAEVVRITDVAYRAGATTNLELIDAQRRARDAETEAAIAEDSLRRSRLELLSAIGRFPR